MSESERPAVADDTARETDASQLASMERPQFSQSDVADLTLRMGGVALLLLWCFQIVAPFLLMLAWAAIIAVGVNPAYRWLERWLGGRQALSASLVVLALFGIMIGPVYILGNSLLEAATWVSEDFGEDGVVVPPPPAWVPELPVVGEALAERWHHASENLEETLVEYAPQIQQLGQTLLERAAITGLALLSFMVSILIAGWLLVIAPRAIRAVHAFEKRIAGQRGLKFARAAEDAIRSVIIGVLGPSVVQAMLAGLGYWAIGIPGAGMLSLLSLVLAIVQISVLPVGLPVAIYVFFAHDLLTAVLFAAWMAFVMVSDNLLKAALMTAESPVPMLVIFLGSMGGFVAFGIIGLFVGAIVLTFGYLLYQSWLDGGSIEDLAQREPSDDVRDG